MIDDLNAAETFFERLVAEAIDRIPPPFAERLGSVAIVIEDEPTREQLASVGAFGLYGLYQGVPRTSWGAESVQIPSKITIFQGPIQRHYPDPAGQAAAVQDTVFHEVAHHFGISDARLSELAQEHRR